MKRIVFALIMSIFIFFVGTGNGMENIRIAVLDLEARGTSKTASTAVSEMLRTEMINMGMFTVIERHEMGVILKEQGFSQTGCTDQDCAVQVGKLLSARKILIGTLTQQGAELLITVRVVDVEKGVAEYGESEVTSSVKILDLKIAVSELTARLSARISGQRIDKLNYLMPTDTKSQGKKSIKYILKITSNIEGAEVFIDGVKAGIAPVTKQLDEGLYRVIVKKKGYSDIDRNVSLEKSTMEKFVFYKDELKTTHSGEYKIGDRGPAGGWIFYDRGTASDGWRYLEAAPEDQGETKWGCSETSIPGVEGTDIGMGKFNTNAIVKGCGESNIAAKIASSYRGGGRKDWFLPSKDELNLMYKNLYKAVIGGFDDRYYWSSSQKDASNAWFQNFSYGTQYDNHKNYDYRVRAVRAF